MASRTTKEIIMAFNEGGDEKELARDGAGQFYVRTVAQGSKKVRCPRWRSVDQATAEELLRRHGGKSRV